LNVKNVKKKHMPLSKKMIKIKNFTSFDRMAKQLVLDFAAQSKKNIAEKGFFSVVLSGGNTPRKLFEKLAEEKLEWDKIFFFFGDERCVPPDNQDSNNYQAERLLFSKIKIPRENIFKIPTEIPFESSAEAYSIEIEAFFGGKDTLPEFDLVYLGMGEDGHTASLFPGSKGLQEENRLAIAVPPPETVEPSVARITMTFPVLKNAKKIQFLISGENKLKLLEKISEGGFSREQYPVKEFLDLENTEFYYTD